MRFLFLAVLILSGCRGDKTAQSNDSRHSYPRVEADLLAIDREIESLRSSYRSETKPDTNPDEQIRRTLAHMVEVDQLVRNKLDLPHESSYRVDERMYFQMAIAPRLREVDQQHTERMKEIIEKNGWISISLYGERADFHAWLLVQHADQAPEFQHQVLTLLESGLRSGDTNPQNFAYLHDRVATAEGRPQHYGTQGRCIGEGRWEPHTLEDSQKVEALRASVGLIPLSAYVESFDCH